MKLSVEQIEDLPRYTIVSWWSDSGRTAFVAIKAGPGSWKQSSTQGNISKITYCRNLAGVDLEILRLGA